jgi:hypothetical protein
MKTLAHQRIISWFRLLDRSRAHLRRHANGLRPKSERPREIEQRRECAILECQEGRSGWSPRA